MLDEKELDQFTDDFLSEIDDETGEGLDAGEIKDKKTKVEQVDNTNLDEEGKKTEGESDGSTFWDGANENQREEVKSLQNQLALSQHSASSDKGRNKALRAKVEQLEEDAKAAKVELAKSKAQTQSDEKQYTDEEISDMKSDLPEVSAIVNQENADLKKRLAQLESKAIDNQDDIDRQPYIDPNQPAPVNPEIAKVEAVHKGFRDTVNSIDYTTWLSRQPSGIQDMARSPQADNAITVISMFKNEHGSNSEQLKDELDSMKDLPSKGLTKSGLESDDDFDAHFERFSKQLSK